MTFTRRLKPDDRRDMLLQIALKVAEKNPQYTFRDVAEAAEVTVPAVIRYFPTKVQMQRDVMRAAVKQEIVPIVARGLIAGDTHARKAPDALRERCQQYLSARVTR